MTAPAGTAADPFSVLVLCTANICRSPAGEAVLRALLGPTADVTVVSAGLSARVGEPLDPRMAAALDVPLPGFRARQVTPAMVAAADLVLTMTRDHRATLLGQVPTALRRTFTVRELAALAALAAERGQVTGSSPAERLASLAVAAPRLRSQRTPGADDDVEDPYGRASEAHLLAVQRIREAMTVLAVVAGSASSATTAGGADAPVPA